MIDLLSYELIIKPRFSSQPNTGRIVKTVVGCGSRIFFLEKYISNLTIPRDGMRLLPVELHILDEGKSFSAVVAPVREGLDGLGVGHLNVTVAIGVGGKHLQAYRAVHGSGKTRRGDGQSDFLKHYASKMFIESNSGI